MRGNRVGERDGEKRERQRVGERRRDREGEGESAGACWGRRGFDLDPGAAGHVRERAGRM